jgi:hypothetical protein
VGRELRPEAGDGRVQDDCAPLDQCEDEHGEHPLADRVGVHHRVAPPRPRALRIAVSAPEVDQDDTIDDDADGRADLAVVDEVRGKGLAHRTEASVAASVYARRAGHAFLGSNTADSLGSRYDRRPRVPRGHSRGCYIRAGHDRSQTIRVEPDRNRASRSDGSAP